MPQPPQFFVPGPVSMLGFLFAPRDYPAFVARFGSAFKLWSDERVPGGQSFIVFSPEDVEQVLTNKVGKRSEASHRELGKLVGESIGSVSGIEHQKQREMLMGIFGAGSMKLKVSLMVPGINWLVQQFEKAAEEKAVVPDAVLLVSRGLLKIFGAVIFGVENLEEYIMLYGAYRRVLATIFERIIRPPFFPPRFSAFYYRKQDQEFDRDADFIRTSVGQMVDAADIAHPGSILALMRAKGISRMAIIDQLVGLLIAAFDATMANTTTSLATLGAYPAAWQTMRAEARDLPNDPTIADLDKLTYTKDAVRELLRLFAPVHVNERFFDSDVTLGQWNFPANSWVYISAPVTQRLPTVWFPDPHVFRPERFRERHYPRGAEPGFGFGSYACIGRGLAQYAQRLLYARLAQRSLMTRLPEGKRIRYYIKLLSIPRSVPLEVIRF